MTAVELACPEPSNAARDRLAFESIRAPYQAALPGVALLALSARHRTAAARAARRERRADVRLPGS